MLVGPQPSPHLAASSRRDGTGGQQRPYYSRLTCGSHARQRLEEADWLGGRPERRMSTLARTHAPSLPPSSFPHGAQRGRAVGRTTPSVRLSRYFLLVALPGNSGRGRQIGVSASACGLLEARSMERRNAKLSQVRPYDGERVEAGRRRGQHVPRVPGLSPHDGRSRGRAPSPGDRPSPAS